MGYENTPTEKQLSYIRYLENACDTKFKGTTKMQARTFIETMVKRKQQYDLLQRKIDKAVQRDTTGGRY
jgi:hypothetical protein